MSAYDEACQNLRKNVRILVEQQSASATVFTP